MTRSEARKEKMNWARSFFATARESQSQQQTSGKNRFRFHSIGKDRSSGHD
jgi:hypothetical protein